MISEELLKSVFSYRHQSSSSSTTEPSTTTSTTTKLPPAESISTSDLLYAQQLKFVVPVPVDDDKGNIPVRGEPWTFDPYVYYPKPIQPSSMNVQVPYNPMFHVIRAVKVPSLEGKENENLD